MPEPSFRGDPYRVLDVPRDATRAELKRRWRELAREHHPDRAAGDVAEQHRLTARMARINAAFDLLDDPVRRAKYDHSPAARRAEQEEWRSGGKGGSGPSWATDGPGARRVDGPPPPPPTRPVTARFDTSTVFRGRDTVTGSRERVLQGQPPVSRDIASAPDLRASTPTGPIRRRATRRPPVPSLEEARAATLEFGRFHGSTLGEVADREPTYIDWIAKTITRDRDLVQHARVIAADMDARGVERMPRPSRPGPGMPAGPGAAEDSAW
jgi:curved DNA-binding protein CbpA